MDAGRATIACSRRLCLWVLVSLCLIVSAFDGDAEPDRTQDDKQVRLIPSGPPAFAEGELLIKFKDNADVQKVHSIYSQYELEEIEELPLIGAKRVRITSGRSATEIIQSLQDKRAKDADFPVEYAEPNYKLHALEIPNDTLIDRQWGYRNIKAIEAWDQQRDSPGVVVAITDTGIDLEHDDLSAHLWRNPNEVQNGRDDDGNGIVDDIHGVSFVNQSPGHGNPDDDEGHGTHVAGIVAAVTDNSEGVAGTTWETQLMALKFLDSGGSGYTADAVKLISYAVNMHANVINASWGGGGFSRSLYDVIKIAGDDGILFVAAAGNSGNGTDNDRIPIYPASYDLASIVSVMASNEDDERSEFSNWGRASVDLAAPGSDILSTDLDDNYAFRSGTSMAAPFVTGAIALLRAQRPNAIAADLKGDLLATVTKKPSMQGLSISEGILNLHGLVTRRLKIVEPATGSQWLGGKTHAIRWNGRSPDPDCPTLTATLSVDDGQSFPYLLAAGIQNNGEEVITVPFIRSWKSRVKLECPDGFSAVSTTFEILDTTDLLCHTGTRWVIPKVEPSNQIAETYILDGSDEQKHYRICHCSDRNGETAIRVNHRDGDGESMLEPHSCRDVVARIIWLEHADKDKERAGVYFHPIPPGP